MSFQTDIYSSAWAHIALCADLTWTTESPDGFIIANQRLWAQHCRVSQVLQETTLESQNQQINQSESDNKRTVQCQTLEHCNIGSRCVKEVIPESRLAQYYGDFFYDELREKCYTNANDRSISWGNHEKCCENTDLTECWMLPEVEFWFRKLLDDSDRNMFPRRRRQHRALPDEDLEVNGHILAASERWSLNGARTEGAEAILAAKVQSVKALWDLHPTRQSPTLPRVPSPPQVSRKMRARRRQPRRLTALAPPPPAYCLEVPAQLFCDPSCKFQFDSPRPTHLTECQRVMGHISLNVQAAMRASLTRSPPYRGTNVSRYAPTGQRPVRYPDRRNGNAWPRNYPSPRLTNKFQNIRNKTKIETEEIKKRDETSEQTQNDNVNEINTAQLNESEISEAEKPESPKENPPEDNHLATTSAAVLDTGLRKKRLYSTVLSMCAPPPINLTPAVRLAQKLVTPGILKLNPKIILPSARIRQPNMDHKFEELEKEALEQYKASDESIDTKFQELEKQAVEQYSTSNSNTSCSSGNSAFKKTSENSIKNKQKNKEKPLDSVVIYSQNFPDLNSKGTSVMSLKNFQSPPRGEKKGHRSKGSRSKNDAKRAASDTDNEGRKSKFKSHKGPKWTLHVVPPKKRHLTLSVSDYSSDEGIEDSAGTVKDAGRRIKNHARKIKLSEHGGGDLHVNMRKT